MTAVASENAEWANDANDGPAEGSVDDVLAKLAAAMTNVTDTADVERRRAAARLAELVKTDDDQLARFARRHFPGRSVEAETVRDLRDLVVGVARLVAVVGRGPAVDDVVANLRQALMPHIDRLEGLEDEAAPAPDQAVEPTVAPSPPMRPPDAESHAVAPPAIVPLQVIPDAKANFPKPSFAQVSAKSVVPAPPRQDASARPTTAEVPAAVMHAHVQAGPAWMASPESAHPQHAHIPPIAPPARAPSSVAPMGLPFSTVASVSHGVAPSLSPSPIPSRSRDALGQTMDQEAAPVSLRSLPFREVGLPPHLAQMSVETYALVFALLHVYPERHSEIFAQYGLRDRADKDALDRHWLSKLTEDAGLSAHWRQLRDQYVAHYRTTR